MLDIRYDVYSKFNLEKHKERFIKYLEVIIEPDGSIHYAVPSHQEYLINYLCRRDGITREELNDICPKEYYMNFLYWLCKESGCVVVWTKFIEFDKPTNAQIDSIKKLYDAGLLKIPAPYLSELEKSKK